MTASEINALPEGPRHYIYLLETMADPAGMVRENCFLRDTIEALLSEDEEDRP